MTGKILDFPRCRSLAVRLIAVLDVLACLGSPCGAQQRASDEDSSRPAAASAQPVRAQRSADTASVQDRSLLAAHVSDARLLVIDPEGRRSGLDTASGQEISEIPESHVDQEAIDNDVDSGGPGVPVYVTVEIDRAAEGTYRLIVVSPDQKRRHLAVNTFSTDGSPQSRIRVPLDFEKTRRAEFRLFFRKTPGSTSRLEQVDPGGPHD